MVAVIINKAVIQFGGKTEFSASNNCVLQTYDPFYAFINNLIRLGHYITV